MLERADTAETTQTGEMPSSDGKTILGLPRAENEPFAGGSPLLVINTNLASALYCKDDSEWDALQWSRLRTAQKILVNTKRKKMVSRRPKGCAFKVETIRKMSESRTAGCFWKAVAFSVEHWKVTRDERVGAYVRSVQICGSRSACPRCSMKIWMADREEIQLALVAVNRLGWEIQHVTFTVSHKRFHELISTLDGLRRASRRMRGGRKWQEFKKQYGVEGSIIVTENNYGLENGHHPHTHEGMVTNRRLSNDERESMRDELAELWLDALRCEHLRAHYEIGVVIQHGTDYFAEYVSKWGHEPKAVNRGGLSYELTSFQNKTKGMEHGHYTMLQLLDLAGLGESWARDAWLDFVDAFEGRAMLRWSAGLRAKLGLSAETESDEQKANRLEQGEKSLFALYHHKAHWLKVREYLPQVLNASKVMEFDAFKDYLVRNGMDAESPLPDVVAWNEDGKL
jgi:hypothetical protein